MSIEYSGVGAICSTLRECLLFKTEDTSELQSLSSLSFPALIPNLVKPQNTDRGILWAETSNGKGEREEIGQKKLQSHGQSPVNYFPSSSLQPAVSSWKIHT